MRARGHSVIPDRESPANLVVHQGADVYPESLSLNDDRFRPWSPRGRRCAPRATPICSAPVRVAADVERVRRRHGLRTLAISLYLQRLSAATDPQSRQKAFLTFFSAQVVDRSHLISLFARTHLFLFRVLRVSG